MNELIKIEEREGIQTVNARRLHEFLKSKQEFAHWIQDRIEKYNFQENIDYSILLLKRSTTGIGRGLKEYHITIDMAMILSTVERSPKGINAYKYFCFIKGQHVIIKHQKRIEYQFEEVIQNLFSQYQIIRQFFVCGKYYIDWYIPKLNLAIEFDEKHHIYNEINDTMRQFEIEQLLGCKFLRYKV